MFGFCLPVSSVSNFRPDTGGRRWSLVRVPGSLALRGGTGAAFPSTLLRLPAALNGACPALRGSSPRVLHESADSAAPAFCAFPVRAAQAARSLTGAFSPPWSQPQLPPAPVGCMCLLPYASPAPVLAGLVPAPCVSLRPYRRMSPIQNLRRSLI